MFEHNQHEGETILANISSKPEKEAIIKQKFFKEKLEGEIKSNLGRPCHLNGWSKAE